jgi:hypothetical protein
VKKQKVKNEPRTAEEVAHLDETLTKATEQTVRSLRRFGKPLAIGLAAVIAVIVLYAGMRAFSESRIRALHERLFAVLSGPVSRNEEPKLAELDALLAHAKGKLPERFILREAVAYFIRHMDQLEAKEKEKEEETEQETEATKEGTASSPASDMGAKEARDRALELARRAATSYAGDAEVEEWAQAVLLKLEGDGKEPWRPPPPRRYGIAAPPRAATDSTAAPAGSSAPPPSGAQDAAKPSPGGAVPSAPAETSAPPPSGAQDAAKPSPGGAGGVEDAAKPPPGGEGGANAPPATDP